MKHRISILFLLCALALSACARQPEEAPPSPTPPVAESTHSEPDAPPPPETDIFRASPDFAEQAAFLAANYEIWKSNLTWDYWGYAVTDLDQNGRAEILISEDHGTSHSCTTAVWEIAPALGGLTFCGQGFSYDMEILRVLAQSGTPQPCGPLLLTLLALSDTPSAYPAYYDAASGLYHYVYSDGLLYKGASQGEFSTLRSFALQDGACTGTLLAYEWNDYRCGSTFWNRTGAVIRAEQYQETAARTYAELTPMTAEILWIRGWDFVEADPDTRLAMLQSSLRAFSVHPAAEPDSAMEEDAS